VFHAATMPPSTLLQQSLRHQCLDALEVSGVCEQRRRGFSGLLAYKVIPLTWRRGVSCIPEGFEGLGLEVVCFVPSGTV